MRYRGRLVFDRVFLTGRIATAAGRAGMRFGGVCDDLVRRHLRVRRLWSRCGRTCLGPLPADLKIEPAVCVGNFVANERELRHLSDDQAICVGYALRSPGTDYPSLPIGLRAASAASLRGCAPNRAPDKIGPGRQGDRVRHAHRARRRLPPQGHVSVSLNHHEQSDWLLLRRVVEDAVETACVGMALPAIEMNGAGMFIAGGHQWRRRTSRQEARRGCLWTRRADWRWRVVWQGPLQSRPAGRPGGTARGAGVAGGERRRRGARDTDVSAGWRPAGRIDLLLDGEPSERIVMPPNFGVLESRVLHDLLSVQQHRSWSLRWGISGRGCLGSCPWRVGTTRRNVGRVAAGTVARFGVAAIDGSRTPSSARTTG